ncbi:MAG: LON peptidase substrate-binding domain-containing protein [Anaerolineales bacterium]|jgi:Lon protease-like protein|nr:LON peptidase substrate-binding domain-containing protein [Anaerolineales bacterium]
MFELPLFPLNTVLFPGMPLNLHIFEDRYTRMIRECIESSKPFGVALIKRGLEAHGPLAEPYEIGCTARIIEVEPLSEGRMNIVALGQKRFRILSLNDQNSFLVGKVEIYPLEGSEKEILTLIGKRLRPWVKRYMDILSQVSDANLEAEHLPNDPLALAYLAAVLLQVPPTQKQPLLAIERAVELLGKMYALYRREVFLLDAIVTKEMQAEKHLFSKN